MVVVEKVTKINKLQIHNDSMIRKTALRLNVNVTQFFFSLGKNRVGKDGGVQSDDEADGFDDHYFRRRPKSFCLPPSNLASQNDPRRFLPPGTLPHIQGGTIPPSVGVPGAHGLDSSLQISMGSLIDEQHQRSMTVV